MGTEIQGLGLCWCGYPEDAPLHNPKGHKYVPADVAAYIRPTQKYRAGQQLRHYSLQETRSTKVVAPAAGVDVKATVPGAAKWNMWSLRASFTTSAIVNGRVPHLQITDGPGGNIVLDVPSPTNQPQGTTVIYCAGAGLEPANFDNVIVFALPVSVELLQNWTIGFATTLLDAGDAWTALALMVTETLYY